MRQPQLTMIQFVIHLNRPFLIRNCLAITVQTKEASVLICDATDAKADRPGVAAHVEAAAVEVQVVTVGTTSAAAPVVPVRANAAGRATAAVAVAGSGEEEGPLGGAGVVGAEQVAGGVSSLKGAAGV